MPPRVAGVSPSVRQSSPSAIVRAASTNGAATNFTRACTACGAKGWLADDGDSEPGRGRTSGACDHAALKTYVRVGTVRLDDCNAHDAVTIVDDASTH